MKQAGSTRSRKFLLSEVEVEGLTAVEGFVPGVFNHLRVANGRVWIQRPGGYVLDPLVLELKGRGQGEHSSCRSVGRKKLT